MQEDIFEKIYAELVDVKTKISKDLDKIENKSLKNLKAYVNLRNMDITTLQNELTSIGLSSLGRSQCCVINSLNKDIFILSKLLNREYLQTEEDREALSFEEANEIMLENATVFGEKNTTFKTRVMVTLPTPTSQTPQLIKELIANGTSVLRINTAHDDASAWKQMAQIIKDENQAQQKETKIYVDLAGPKIRTSHIKKVFTPFTIGSKKEPELVEIAPQSQPGAVTRASYKELDGTLQEASLVVSDEAYAHLLKASHIKIDDFERETIQKFDCIQQGERIFAKVNRKITVYEDTNVKIVTKHHKYVSALYNLDLKPQKIRLFRGNKIIITLKDILGCQNYQYNGIEYNAIIGCTNKEIFDYVKIDDVVFIDDGKIGCIVREINDIGLVCEVNIAKDKGVVLKEEKGINFPNSDLQLSAITPSDEKNFEEIVVFADLIGISFAQTGDDIEKLKSMLTNKGKFDVAIVPKIETKIAIKNLPQILQSLLRWKKYALMIARGDLAIEVGFENLPYIQEEIYGICEAAHVPVIYATQILEGQMKNNIPSRAEVIDAAFSQRADCVMLNKGPFVVGTVIAIKNILRKIHMLYQKNRQLLNIFADWKMD